MLQDFPAPRLFPQAFVSEKCPVAVMLVMLSDAFPVLVSFVVPRVHWHPAFMTPLQ